MTASQKAKKTIKIASIVGLIIAFIFVIAAYYDGDTLSLGEYIIVIIGYPVLASIYAFGYVFGWKRCNGLLSTALNISRDIAIFACILEIINGRGLRRGLIIAFLVLWISVCIVWIPGIVFGITDLVRERRTART